MRALPGDLLHSLSFKLLALIVLFAGIPPLLYSQFKEADLEKRKIIDTSLRTQGRVIAESLRPDLERFEEGSLARLNARLREIGDKDLRIKLLFRPKAMRGGESFFYIASSTHESMEYLALERDELSTGQVLSGLDDSCANNRAGSAAFQNPDGELEIFTAIVPRLLASGCWVVLISSVADGRDGERLLGRAYWREREVVLAGLVLLAGSIFVLSLFVSILLALRRFVRLAQEIGAGGEGDATFVERNTLPELHGVAREFDRLVTTLRTSASAIRDLAEENAHAVKAPIGVIAQSIEPLKRTARQLGERERRAIGLIEQSVERLDDIVSQGRDIGAAQAELMAARRFRSDIGALMTGLAAAYRPQAEARGIVLDLKRVAHGSVLSNVEQLETAIENVIDNALDFTPAGGRMELTVERRRRHVVVRVADDGPGVPEADLERIFERSVSIRTPAADAKTDGSAGPGNFGIGLWLARRNILNAGGDIRASNRPNRGLEIEIELPLAD